MCTLMTIDDYLCMLRGTITCSVQVPIRVVAWAVRGLELLLSAALHHRTATGNEPHAQCLLLKDPFYQVSQLLVSPDQSTLAVLAGGQVVAPSRPS